MHPWATKLKLQTLKIPTSEKLFELFRKKVTHDLCSLMNFYAYAHAYIPDLFILKCFLFYWNDLNPIFLLNRIGGYINKHAIRYRKCIRLIVQHQIQGRKFKRIGCSKRCLYTLECIFDCSMTFIKGFHTSFKK